MTRRQFAAIGATAVCGRAATRSVTLEQLQRAPWRAVLEDGSAGPKTVTLERRFDGGLCRPTLRNTGGKAVRIREVVLCAIDLALPADTGLYGESFQMLSETGGTLAHPADLGYSEQKHYRIPQPEDARSLFGMMTLSPEPGRHVLVGFTSCRKYAGRFYLRPASLEVVVDTEGLALAPGESWDLEEFLFAAGADRNALLEALADRIRVNHPPLEWKQPPAGWCSWYCFGPRVTAQNVLDNLDAIARNIPELKYIQLDDGYQAAMGDWLETGNAFGGDIRKVLAEIRRRGFEPAIWVAPFIAEAGSRVFREHPDWFMRGDDGQPLNSERVTFRGWRRGPWYALDGTNPAVQKHFEELFRTLRNEWGCTYFKLDANFWGAMHGGRLHDPKATRVEAYRRGMEAIRRGAGDAFLLGCNHPVWASFGLIHGSRSSDDISRKWEKFTRVARLNLSRNWQNGRLWWNDPDCVVLTGDLPEEEFRFHATAAYASGGLMLSGDDLTRIAPERLAMLRRMVPATGVAARFEDASLRVGHMRLADRWMICVLNWGDEPAGAKVRLPQAGKVAEVWTGEDLGRRSGSIEVRMPPRSGRLFEIRV
jgi:alpha-galactosidase